MTDGFPIPIPERLPSKIEPCPILQAIFEVRFSSNESWTTMPGLLYAQIRDKYPEKRDLPLAGIPDEIRRRDFGLARSPLMQFLSPGMLLQLGPNVISLVTKPSEYPGWPVIQAELKWMLECLQKAGFVSEGERLGVRYVDFFARDIFPDIILGLQINDAPLSAQTSEVTTVLRKDKFSIRLNATNGAIVERPGGPMQGSILDLDVSLGALDFDVFKDGSERFVEAHRTTKELFFGLLRPDFLAGLNPIYA